VVGERVELKTTSGGTVLVGLVERIDVMRTLVRTDKGVPVAVPNSSITSMIVSNESRLGKSQFSANFKVGPRMLAQTRLPKLLPQHPSMLSLVEPHN
jgi:small-conductance mechanosensitive channel